MSTSPPMMMLDTARAGTAAFKDMGLAWRAFMGIGEQQSWGTLRDFARAPATESWVYSCVRRRYTAAMSVPLTVWVKDGKRRIPAAESSDQAAKDLQNLLDDVNPVNMQGGDLKAYLEAGLSVWGEGYIKKVRGRLGGPPQELYWLPAPDMKPSPEQGPAHVTAWTYQPNGLAKAETYPMRDIIAYRTVNLQDPRRGLSPLASVRNEMRVNIGASENTASTLENWGVPPGAWVAPKGADISPQDQRLITRALKALRGPRNQGKTPVLPEGLDWKPLSLTPKDAEWLAARKVSRMTVCAAMGVPLVLAGDDDGSSVYGDLRDAERVFWRNTMIPELDWIADGFNSWLVPDFAKDKHILVAFDYSQIESLRAAPAEEMAQWASAVHMGLPMNRFIERFGMGGPIPDGDLSRIMLRTNDSTTTTLQPKEVDMLGALVRAGFDPSASTEVLGLPHIEHLGLEPVTVSEQVASPGSLNPAGPKPRPAEYNTGKSAVVALGKGLYKHAAVRAYLETGDAAVLETLVPEDDVETLALGLQRRLPAAKLAEAWEPVPVPAPAPVLIPFDSARLEAAAERAMVATIDSAMTAHHATVADASKAVMAHVDRSILTLHARVEAVEGLATMAGAPKAMKVLSKDDHGRTLSFSDGDVIFDVERDAAGRVTAKVPRV